MVIRWAFVVLAVALGVVLLVDGYPLIGAAVALVGVVRSIMLVRWQMHPERHPPHHHGYSDPG